MKYIRVCFFLSENVQFLEVKLSIYLNRCVFVMTIADNTIKVGYAVISADWRSADRSYFSDFRLHTHAAQ